MVVEGPTHHYGVVAQVADAGKYRLYLCQQIGTGRQCLLQIPTEAAHNGAMDRAAYVLDELKREADRLEAEYARVRTDPKMVLNYDLGFPELVDSFVVEQQGGRRVNILAFRNVEDVSRMVPIGNITARDRLRVDLRTSGWIMGKALKILVLAHSLGFAIKRTDAANILIEQKDHYVVLFDWSDAEIHSGVIPAATRRREISQVARAVIVLLGGDLSTGVIPNDGDTGHAPYVEQLLRLARGSESNAQHAHASFYKLIGGLWEHGYHPFTAYQLT